MFFPFVKGCTFIPYFDPPLTLQSNNCSTKFMLLLLWRTNSWSKGDNSYLFLIP